MTELRDFPLSEIKALAANQSSSQAPVNQQLRIVCSSGATHANWSFNGDPEHECQVTDSSGYLCSGENRTIGIAVSATWTAANGDTQSLIPWEFSKNGRHETLQLQSGSGVITLPRAFVRTVPTKTPTAGLAEAHITMKVWAD